MNPRRKEKRPMNGRDPNSWQGLLDFLPITLVAILTFTMGFYSWCSRGRQPEEATAWRGDVHTFGNTSVSRISMDS